MKDTRDRIKRRGKPSLCIGMAKVLSRSRKRCPLTSARLAPSRCSAPRGFESHSRSARGAIGKNGRPQANNLADWRQAARSVQHVRPLLEGSGDLRLFRR